MEIPHCPSPGGSRRRSGAGSFAWSALLQRVADRFLADLRTEALLLGEDPADEVGVLLRLIPSPTEDERALDSLLSLRLLGQPTSQRGGVIQRAQRDGKRPLQRIRLLRGEALRGE